MTATPGISTLMCLYLAVALALAGCISPAVEREPIAARDAASFTDYLRLTQDWDDVRVYEGNTVELLVDGPDAYKRMLEAVANSRHHVHLETFIFADGSVGQRFSSALIAAAQRGVEVRVNYDAVGSLSTPKAFFDALGASGVEVIAYNSPNPLEGGNPLAVNQRSHRKLLIVDGRIAFTGGINITDNYSSS